MWTLKALLGKDIYEIPSRRRGYPDHQENGYRYPKNSKG
jgi:hypothetical protein